MSDWAPLRRYTDARIGQARAGSSVSTSELLRSQLAHARARDSVLRAWDVEACSRELQAAGIEHCVAKSRAADRETFLARPDLGRQLDPESLAELRARRSSPAPDVALLLSGGWSASAAQTYGVATLRALLEAIHGRGLQGSPVVLVENASVALSDVVGDALAARAAVIVLGERPNSNAADSLAIYLTHGPKPGNSDAQRNSISNVRGLGGVSPPAAAAQLASLLTRALERAAK